MRRLKGNRRSLSFKQSEVERAIRAVQAQDLPVERIEIDPQSGKIAITTISGLQTVVSEIGK